MNNLHQEYLDRGESIYTAKIDSVQAFSGINKARFVFDIKADPRITEVEITWNEGVAKKERSFPVNRSTSGPVTMNITIEDIPEGTFYFEFTTKNDEGNRSVSIGKTVDIYGEIYFSSLPNKLLKNAFVIGNELMLTWGIMDNDLALFTKVYYKNTAGQRVEKKILKADTKTTLYDYDSELGFQTFFLIDPTVIDTFYSLVKVPDVLAYPLVNRKVAVVATFGNGLTVSWANQDGREVEFFYTDINGQSATKIFPVNEISCFIDDYGSGPLSLRTTHQPALQVYQTGIEVYTGTIANYAVTVTSTTPAIINGGDFDLGGEGIGFHDSNTGHDPGSGGANYRPSRGDTQSAAMDIEGDGGNIGYTNTGEWVIYTIRVEDAGDYEIDWRISVNGSGAACHIEVDGVAAPVYNLENNSNWSDWRYYCERQQIDPPVFHLSTGKHTVMYYWNGASHNYMGLRLTYKN
jgi:hypothetical protein